jgi:SAM-dependent methyltransferase
MPANAHQCRACRSEAGHVVLDLGSQPACDYFPSCDDPGPDPVYPLQMWLCAGCGLAQLLDDPTVPEEPRGTEPAALIAQAVDAVNRVAAAGAFLAGARVAEYGSPHGGSWLGLLSDKGLRPVDGMAQADIILDCFGMMHAADQSAALAERAARLAPEGILLLQYHSLDTIIRQGQWNALRHGHYAYYSTTALSAMLAAVGFSPRAAWRFDLYGGTVLLAATRDSDDASGHAVTGAPNAMVPALLAAEARTGVRDPDVLRGLQRDVRARAAALRGWLAESAAAGKSVIGYGAASRAVALLRKAGIDGDMLPAVADASPAKRGLRMPGTTIPVISPAELVARRPDEVALFVSDLMAEVRATYPEIEASGGRWVDADALGSDQQAASSTRNRARQRPLVGPILPTGSPSSSEISA